MPDILMEKLLQDIAELKTKVNMLVNIETERLMNHQKRFEDHERRLRFMERYIFVLIGASSVAGFIISLIK